MKKPRVVVAPLLFVVGLTVSAEAQNQNRQESDLVKGRAGFMVVGKSLYDGLSPVDEVEVNEESGIVEIRRGGKLFVRLEVKMEMFASLDYVVKAIHVVDGKFRTVSGIGVGSTLSDIMTKYPNFVVDKTPDGRWAGTVNELEMGFWFGSMEGRPGDECKVVSVTVQ